MSKTTKVSIPQKPFFDNIVQYWHVNVRPIKQGFYEISFRDFIKEEYNCEMLARSRFLFDSNEEAFVFIMRWSK